MLTLQLHHRIASNFIISDPNSFIKASLHKMDGLYGISNSKVPKRNCLSPISNFASQNPFYQHIGPVVDQYASPDGHSTVLKNLNAPFLRYFQSPRSLLTLPSSAGDHLPSPGYKHHRSSINRVVESSLRLDPPRRSRSPLIFSNTPVKVEEDVLVMDGVLVKNPPVDKGSRSLSASLTDSGGSSSSSGGKNYKMDLCLSYLENSGFCRYGTKCQFAHGNKELRPSQISYKSVLESPCKNYSISGNSSFGSKCHFPHQETSTSAFLTEATSTSQPVSPIKLDEFTSSIVNLKSTDWSPLDDDIEIQTATGNTFSKEDIDAHIKMVVYGPKSIKRLPVFIQILPE